MIPIEIVPGIEGRKMKDISEKGEFKYDMFDTL
jgi:hypothetical protein